MKGVLERFTDRKQAVILIEERDEEMIVPISTLPQGSRLNTWFNLEKKHNEFVIISIDEEKTAREINKSAILMEKLRKKKKESKFKRE